MKLKVSYIIIAFLALTHSSCGQSLDSRFIVLLGHFTQPFLNETVIHCAGTLVSQQHILTTASCVIVEAPVEVAVNLRETTLVPEGGNFSISTLVPAFRVFIHPFYEGNQYTNNAAIVMTNFLRDNPSRGFAPRSLGSLTTSTACNLFGWGGEVLDPRRDSVMVNNAQYCDPNYPQNFCTLFDSISHSTCTAMQGSPLTCGNDMMVAGFTTNIGGCSTNDTTTVLNYHSIDHFRDWIVGVFGPELPVRDPANFIVTIVEYVPPISSGTKPRCFGTIIASNRVLTTVTCVTVELPLELGIETRIVSGSTSFSTVWPPSRIFIHPRYREENPFENNVAIMQINYAFNQLIVPRSLGSLQTNSSCQLFGWGPTDIRFTRGDAVTINEPQYCDPNLPQSFCSSHPTIFHYSCNAMTGSPITCGGNESVVAGFLINNATCNSDGNRGTLRYHSVSQFTDWILNPTDEFDEDEDESNAATTTKNSIVFIFLIALISGLIK